ncbi:hypothetical protein DBR40_21620 [Pedobacter sp. KBW01]|uniref:hypothetical protein n=1 Tax=Pedobacter sp. KBW01 TaxID=2153364 RepID=UPI000F5AB395|nr:hypothetical protein [Pedobacter sp. KBW01]RQO66854.1 hypothetical protein DBR40_21620 [Pedobacter sp. KBW01]
MNPVEYIISLRDQATPVLAKIAESIGLVMNRFKQLSNESLAFVRTVATRIGTIYTNVINNIASGITRGINNINNTASRAKAIYDSTVNSVKAGATKVKDFITTNASKPLINPAGLGVSQLIDFGKKIKELTEEYNGFKETLGETFNSRDIGDSAMNAISQFAVKSPSQLADVVESFDNLAKNGINPTSAELTSLGDLAASKGKKFEDIGSALLSAQGGDFQALKQLGVEATASGDKVKLSFNGLTKTVENNGQAMKTALAEYGNMNGIAGSMEKVGHSVEDITSFKFLAEYIPVISRFFEILQSNIQPVINSVWNFLRAMFGLDEGGDSLSVFKDILSGALFVVDLLSSGVATLIDWLAPLAPSIFAIVASVAAFNLVMAMNPISWVVLGIIALITIIGLVVKYTDGWGKSWNALGTMFRVVWDQIGADFNFGIDSMVYGFTLIYLQAKDVVEQIVGTFSNLGEAIGMALDGNVSGAMDRAFQGVRTEAGAEIERLRKEHQTETDAYYRGTAQRGQKLAGAANQLGISFDVDRFSKDVSKVASGLSGAGQDTSSYDKFARDNKGTKDKSGSKPTNVAGGITGGGTQTSHITINLAKMQDQIVINTINSGEGATKMRQMLEEELNRLLGSITLMQTA